MTNYMSELNFKIILYPLLYHSKNIIKLLIEGEKGALWISMTQTACNPKGDRQITRKISIHLTFELIQKPLKDIFFY